MPPPGRALSGAITASAPISCAPCSRGIGILRGRHVSGRPGLFLARRIGSAARPDGAIVVKVEFDKLVGIWRTDPGQTLVMDGRGIILFATDPDERFRTTRP